MSDHFKEPLNKLDALINKLEANVGTSHAAEQVAAGSSHHGHEKKHDHEKNKEPQVAKCTLPGPTTEAKLPTSKETAGSETQQPKTATESVPVKQEVPKEKKEKPQAQKKGKAPDLEKKVKAPETAEKP